ncbi:hypothetical protein J2T57_003149 [Natronocella acetinitrilica]|uniref:DUF4382 domain-containing protein n=1 Tax=Natronocella acetinitrilica TaxID=414046 RepID=A0AAE3KCM9_9GAMM|nr:DUF4382 domain-containing protein [Natronocella acetinitrilica]MCP1675994.1 hypothetical protein [Natronocella acetinitrilica]
MHWQQTYSGFKLAAALAAAAALAGCNLGSSDSSGSSGSGTGTASFAVTDAPVDGVTNVFVTFDAIELKPANGSSIRIDLDEPVREDLLALQGENSAVLINDVELPAGQYNWIRLFVVSDGLDDADVEPSAVVELDGGEYELFVPGNQPPSRNPNQRFVQLSSPFVVPVDDHANFTIDVDLRKALVRKDIPPYPRPFYMLRPSLRIVDNQKVGTIYGEVAESLFADESCNVDTDGSGSAVYVYRGFDASLGDVFLEEGEVVERDEVDHPVTTANVRHKPDDEGMESYRYRYTIGFLTAGDYTVAFTCQARDDDPEEDDDIVFLEQHNVTVEAGDRVRQDFGVE